MKFIRALLIFLLPCTVIADDTESLSTERQQQIIDWYQWAQGQESNRPTSAAGIEHNHDEALKCGLPIVSDFIANRDKLDPALLKSSGVKVSTRPTPSESYVSPSGLFRIHFDRTGASAVYRSGVDNNSNGIPDYVDTVAMVFDSVYDHTINILGYPVPLSDGFYAEGGDDKFDVYLSNLNGRYYGLTYPDSVFVDGQNVTVATAWMELDNDYQESSFLRYRNRPLDAVRVTAAHEFFHAIHFALDYLETEVRTTDGFVMRYWMEMSAVWLEEEMYDDINDYYTYLPVFYTSPRISIQSFRDASDLHPYASALFPIFMTEKFDRDVVRDIWTRCRQLGSGPSFLAAVSMFADSVDALTSELISFESLFAEFTVWNFFTGYRSSLAPNNLGYPEKWVYPAYPVDSMAAVTEYPTTVLGNNNRFLPQHCGEAFLIWDQTQAIDYTVDQNLEFFLGLGNGLFPPLPNDWGIAVMYQLEQDRDSIEIEYIYLPDDQVAGLAIPDPREFRSITLALSPASIDPTVFRSTPLQFFSYTTTESLVDSLIDTTGGGVLPVPKFIPAPSMFVAPYPNPAVVADMSDPVVRFRVDVTFDSANFIFYQADPPYITARAST